MPKVSKETASQVEAMEGFEGRYEKLEGYTVGFESYDQDWDAPEMFRGLPGDRCQAPHWGIVRRGRIGYRFAGHEETYVEGEAYYVPPGHTPIMYAGSEVVEFSPTDELQKTIDVVTRNLEAAAKAA